MEELLKELVELNEAIDAYEYLETSALDEDILTESLQLHIRQEDMSKLFQIPIGKIFATLNNVDVFPLMREFNRKLSDYKIAGKDAALTINKMKIYIFINGTLEERELLTDKLDSLEKKIARSYSRKNEEIIDVPYGSIKSIYSLYKKIEKRKTPLKESVISDAKFAVKMDPEEYIINNTFNSPGSSAAFRQSAFHGDSSYIMDIANRRLEKAQADPKLSKMINDLKKELSKNPVDRRKTKELLDQFKDAYNSSNIKKDVKQDLKLEKINSKRKTNQLYEHILEGYLEKFSDDIENDNNIERINYFLEESSKEV